MKIKIECSECKKTYETWPYIIAQRIKPYICKSCRISNKEEVQCLQCGQKFTANRKTHRKFCSSSCSCIFSNKNKAAPSEEHRNKTSKSLKLFYKNNSRKPTIKKDCKIRIFACKNCKKLFIKANAKKNLYKLTCSRECNIQLCVGNRPYQNGSRKPVYYFNIYENKKVLLESSWEVKVAKKLDDLSINWIRPKPLQWYHNNKIKYYFPDFYLPKFNLYLDPKNPYCMTRDIDKMKYFSSKINIIYGDINKILDAINKLI